jgi:hypothetical protein
MFKVVAVEIADCSLADAAEVLEEALRQFPGEVTHILPCRASYSMPAGEGSMRDYHYSQNGYLIVGQQTPEP